MSNDTFFFHVSSAGAHIDKDNAIIRGMALITGGIEAEGHNLHVDDTTLAQIHSWAVKRKKITVKADHKGSDGKTFKAIVGYLENFSKDGSKVRGDLHLLKSEPMTPKILEMGERMPENFGLSVAFKGKGTPGKGGKQFARCEKLISCDLVEQPAANPDGAFSVPVDTGGNGMADTQTNATTQQQGAEPTLADVLNAVNALGERINAIEGFQNDLQNSLNEPDLAELANMTDEQLGQAGYDVDAVRDAIEQAVANGELTHGDGDPNAGGGQPAAGGAGAGAGAGAGEGAALTVGKAQKLIQFEIAKVRKAAADAAEAEQAEHALGVIEAKVTELAAAKDELTTQLAAKEAECDALRLTLKTAGVRAAGAGVEAITLFAAKNAPEGSFEQLVTTKFEELKGKDGVTEVQARSQAIQFCVRSHPGAFADYRQRGGKIQL